MKKRLFLLFTVLCLLLSVLPVAFATETEATEQTTNIPRDPGYCGETMTWELNNGVLTISGDGMMDDFPENAPWVKQRDEIVSVVFTGDVTYIGQLAFWDCDKLESVDVGDTLKEIGKDAFKSCDVLPVLYLPATFKVFGEGSLQSCPALKALYCAGRFPSFRLNCLWDTYLTIYYSADHPWSETTIAELEKAFKGRVSFEPADNVLPPDPTEPTESTEPTEETTEPTEVTTEPTEEETVPVTEETSPTTEATDPEPEPTEEVTEPEETTEPPEETEPEEEKTARGSGSWIGLAIIAVVLLILAAGTLLFGRKGKYSR